MNKVIAVPIFAGIVIVIFTLLLMSNNELSESDSQLVYETGFTYYDIEKIQNALAEQNIFVSSPTAITDHTTSQYCAYFEKGLLRNVEYCTTTAVLDVDGNPLGNINIGGNTQSPVLAIANLETLTLESNRDNVLVVFETVIEILVCDCWDEKSGEYESISDWLDTTRAFYADSGNRNVKSKIDNLEGYEIFLEITSKDNSVLQTLIILK
ncbi:hypothetical protein [Nitrosopumilus sp.]|uniref:hypothetical protein n=1 Tax=Nitrosopumilus sp. TaxID=2024843 RepID=UPI0034A08612